MSVQAPLRLCVLNCYPRATREAFDRQDVGQPHELFRAFLRRWAPNASADLVFLADAGARLPAPVEAYDGFLWTGSDLTVYHSADERVSRQLELARDLYRKGAWSWGSCWGLQVSAVAAGGEVAKNPRGREWAVARAIRVTAEGRRSPLLAGKPDRFDGLIMHLDEATRLPPGAEPLAANEHTRVQALLVRAGDSEFWSTQYHPEYDLREMARLVAARAAPLVKEGFFPDEEAVKAWAGKLKALHAEPGDEALRRELGVGPDLLDPALRERELRNWVEALARRTR